MVVKIVECGEIKVEQRRRSSTAKEKSNGAVEENGEGEEENAESRPDDVLRNRLQEEEYVEEI